jgi:hypothetical protein
MLLVDAGVPALKPLFGGLVSLIVLSISHPALAQAPPPRAAGAADRDVAGAGTDELTLKNGGMLRGTIVAIEPDSEVVILVPGREPRRVPWAEIDKMDRGKYAAPAVPPPPSPAPPLPVRPVEPLRAGEGSPRVHIRTDAPGLALHEVTREVSSEWRGGDHTYGPTSRPVCTAPCDEIVDAHGGQSFFFSGPGLRPSPRFQLKGQSGDVFIDVKPGSSAAYTLGSVMAAVGGASVGLGALLVGMGTHGSLTYDSAMGMNELTPDRGLQIGGGVGIGVGLGVLAGGIALMFKNATTYSFMEIQRSGLVVRF